MLLDIPAQLGLASGSARQDGPRKRATSVNHEHRKEKTPPDAFAFALFAHKVHAVVPITGADEREAVLPESEPSQERSPTVFV
jgi:hypothetical protein